MVVADHRLVLRCRGTFCTHASKWEELDYFMVSERFVGRCGKLKTARMEETDHVGKIMSFRLALDKDDKWNPKSQLYWKKSAAQVRRGFDADRLKDPKVKENTLKSYKKPLQRR